MIPHCLMSIWLERNSRIFEGTEKSTRDLILFIFQTLLGWKNALGVLNFTSLSDLLDSCTFSTTQFCLRSVQLERWKNGKIENGEKIQKWRDGRNFSFPLRWQVWGVEKWRDGKLFCLVEKKNERIENDVCRNLLSCPY